MSNNEFDDILPEKKKKQQEPAKIIDIDMNPMVDLAFLLLTFFMLTTTLNNPNALNLVVPAKPKDDQIEKQQPIKESLTINFVLEEDNRAFWYRGITEANPQEINLDEVSLSNFFKEKLAEIPEMVLLIKPHPKSKYKQLVNTLDEVNMARIPRYSIVSYSDFDAELKPF
jgi:biopolymer transport protein ExbD